MLYFVLVIGIGIIIIIISHISYNIIIASPVTIYVIYVTWRSHSFKTVQFCFKKCSTRN